MSVKEVAGSSYINHFLQPDTIIPDPANPQAFNRYSYVANNPINFNDPTGHAMKEDDGGGDCDLECLEKDNKKKDGGGEGGGSGAGQSTYSSFDGGWNYPQYSTWNLLRQGSPCAACHFTHWTGKIPTNGEIDLNLVQYYRSLDDTAKLAHTFALEYANYVALEIQALNFGKRGYVHLTKTDYDKYGKDWGLKQVFVTDETGARMAANESTLNGINEVLGKDFKPGDVIYRVEIPNIHNYNPRMPTSGNDQFLYGGFTMGGAPERVIAPGLDLTSFGLPIQIFP